MVRKLQSPHFSFQLLLCSLLLLLFIPGLFYGTIAVVTSRILFTVILLVCLYLTASNRRDLIIGCLLAIPALTSNWLISLFVELSAQSLIYSISLIIFISFIVSVIFRYLIAARRVDSEMIYAAVCLYMLIGLCWTMIYFAIITVDPGAIKLHVATEVATENASTALLHELIYFSFVTQTTLGYGDLTPVTGIARSFVIAQSLIGQIYVAVIIARLVGLQIAGVSEHH